MPKRRRFLPVALGLFFFIGWPLGARRLPDFSALEKVILAELADTHTPGAAVAIVRGNRIVFAKGFGTGNVETGTPVTADMLFRIGSVTKMFTSAALTTLAEQGKLNLDVPVALYLKNLPARLAQVTAHQLMSHTSGLRDDAPGYGAHDADVMARFVRSWNDDWFLTEPGRVFSYSNPGFTLAGFLAQEVSGRSFSTLLSDLLFDPLGMSSTTFEPTVAMTRPLAQGHTITNGRASVVRPFVDDAGYWPAGFMFSSVNDLARFTIAFMNGGNIDGRDVLSPAVIAKMSTGYAPTHGGSADREVYGYGLFIREFRGIRIFEHKGNIQGFGARITMVPEQQFALIVLTNKSGGQLPKTADAAMTQLLPLRQIAARKEAPPAITTDDLRSLPGIYAHGPSVIEVLARGGALILKRDNTEWPLRKISETRFTTTAHESPEFVAVRSAIGRVEYLHSGMKAFARRD